MIDQLRARLRQFRGLSACSIVSALVPELYDFCDGMTAGDLGNWPWDPSDFARCRGVLLLIPNGIDRIGEVAAKYPTPQWQALAAAWPELEALFVEESKRTDKIAPKLYARMGELTK